MKAEIFCLESQARIAEELEFQLRRQVFDRMRIDRRVISNNYSRSPKGQDHQYCRSFLKLFKASMIKVDDFAIVVTDGKGSWYYMGYYFNGEEYLLDLLQESMTSIFPAVAIMNRMVLLPHNVGDAFEKSRVFPWFVKSRDLGGAVLADFCHPDSVEDGIRQVAVQLKGDIAKLCKRHTLFRKIPTPDFVELGQLLDVDERYLELHRADLTDPLANLRVRLVSGAVRVGIASKVVLDMQYEFEALSGIVIVNVNAPAGTLKRSVAATLDLSKGKGSRRIEFDVTPKTRPYCPLEVLYSLDDTHAVSAPFPIPLVLDVEP